MPVFVFQSRLYIIVYKFPVAKPKKRRRSSCGCNRCSALLTVSNETKFKVFYKNRPAGSGCGGYSRGETGRTVFGAFLTELRALRQDCNCPLFLTHKHGVTQRKERNQPAGKDAQKGQKRREKTACSFLSLDKNANVCYNRRRCNKTAAFTSRFRLCPAPSVPGCARRHFDPL